jgi:hypothetical protein
MNCRIAASFFRLGNPRNPGTILSLQFQTELDQQALEPLRGTRRFDAPTRRGFGTQSRTRELLHVRGPVTALTVPVPLSITKSADSLYENRKPKNNPPRRARLPSWRFPVMSSRDGPWSSIATKPHWIVFDS